MAFLALVALASVAQVADPVTYSYDPFGRLIHTVGASSALNGVNEQANYGLDGSPTNVAGTGAASSALPLRVIVIPVNGFTIMSLRY